ncbi:MAG: protease [Chloroflexota bacterium]|jgi:protease I|nr:protease [Chloroflexota bacterium]
MELDGIRVAVLAEAQYEDLELWYPYLRLQEAGAEVFVVGSGSADQYNSKHGVPIMVDAEADTVNAEQFDAIVIPGGWAPDYMRRHPAVLNFVRDAADTGRVVAAICHAGSVLVSARVLRGRTVTCFHAIKDDVINAGARYVDQDVVRDGNFITSRQPTDLPAFCRTLVATLAERGPLNSRRGEPMRIGRTS